MNRRQSVVALVVVALAAIAVALLLVHTSTHQTLQGSRPSDPDDPDSVSESTSARVECVPAASGPLRGEDGSRIDGGRFEEAEDVSEDNAFELDQRGIDVDEATAVCERKRTARVVQAGELGGLGILLAGVAVLVHRGGRRDEDAPRAPRPSRGEREGGVL